MNFRIKLGTAAGNNDAKAKAREATRMAILGYCLQKLGHRVFLHEPPDGLTGRSERWEYFRHLTDPLEHYDVTVMGSDILEKLHVSRGKLVGFKTSVSCEMDSKRLRRCDVLLAHEYNPNVEERPNLLPVPFIVHDCILTVLIEDGLFDAYLNNDLAPIRQRYCTERPSRLAGFVGVGAYGRLAWGRQLPDWCELVFADSPAMRPREYLHWLGDCRYGIHMPGDTPKANRFSELALLGKPIITVPVEPRNTPPITSDNTILLSHWGDHGALEGGMLRARHIRDNADRDYINGWSPMGQAGLLIKALEAECHAHS